MSFAVLALALAATAAARPNIVVFLADDLGYGDLPSYGNQTIRAPGLTRMAAEGLQFNAFYMSAPICTPSRASLLTGRLPFRTGVYSAVGFPADVTRRVFTPLQSGGLPTSEVTIPEALARAGYRSKLVGKWHLGHAYSLPTQSGFDEFFGIPYSHQEGVVMCDSCEPDAGTWQRFVFPPTPLMENMDIIEQPVDMDTITDRYTKSSIEFMERNAAAEDPFFLMVGYAETHVPVFASERLVNSSAAGRYGDCLENMDESIAEILEAVRNNQALVNNTLVVFTSDNGAWLDQGENGGSNGILRGQKGQAWEGGHRVPTVMWGPGLISQPGRQTEAAVSSMDLLPTFAELAGVELDPSVFLDGVSFSPLLRGDSRPEPPVFFYRDAVMYAARVGAFKAHFVTRSSFGLEPPEPQNPPLLFNLERDPGETTPLNVEEYAAVLDEIMDVIAAHEATIGELPEPELDPFDPFGAPCCDRETDCVCRPDGNVIMSF